MADDDCKHCGLCKTPEGHDGCLGTIPGIMNACCGHGGTHEGAYIQYWDGSGIHDEAAEVVFAHLKKVREMTIIPRSRSCGKSWDLAIVMIKRSEMEALVVEAIKKALAPLVDNSCTHAAFNVGEFAEAAIKLRGLSRLSQHLNQCQQCRETAGATLAHFQDGE